MRIERILVSQPQPTHPDAPYSRLSRSLGVEVRSEQFIRVDGISVNEFRKQRILLDRFPMLLLNTRTGVDNYFRLAGELRYSVPESMRYFCTSEAIASYLQKYTVYRKRKVFVSSDGTLGGLLPHMLRFKDERFLMPCSRTSKADPLRVLRKEGLRITRSVMFETVSVPVGHLPIEDYQVLVFYSPFSVESLLASFPNYEQGDQIIAAYGRNTHYVVRKYNLRLDVMVPSARYKNMPEALEAFIRERNGE